MALITRAQADVRAEEIIDETAAEANTCGRVGSLFRDLADSVLFEITGDISVPAGSSSATITNGAVTNAKLRNSAGLSVIGRSAASVGAPADIVANNPGDILQYNGTSLLFAPLAGNSIGGVPTDRLLGRDSPSTGAVEFLTVGGGLQFTSGGGIQRDELTGDVTASAGSTTTTIAANAVTDAKLRDSAALSVIGRGANSSGDPGDIAAGTDGHVLRRAGAALAFGLIVAAGITDGAITDAKLRDSAALSVIGRTGNTTGAPADIVAGTDDHVLRRAGTALAFGTVATGGIANDAITDAKLRNSAALSVIGRSANSSGDPADIVAANDGEVLRRSGTSIGFGTITSGGIADNSITLPKLAQIATNSLLGRDTDNTGNVEVIALNATLEMNGAGALQRAALTGDVTAGAGSNATTIAADVVSDAKLRNSIALSVIGRAANSTGDPADIQAANDGEVLRRSGTALAFGTIASAGIADNAITDTKFRDSAALSVIGRAANSSGDPADIVAGSDGHVLRRSGASLGFGTIATPGIGDSQVTLVKIANIASSRILGRVSGSAGIVEELTAAQVLTLIGVPAGATTTVQYNSAGTLAGATGVRVVNSGTSLEVTGGFPSGLPTTGYFRVPQNSVNNVGILVTRNFLNDADVNLVSHGILGRIDGFTIGSTGVAGTWFNIATSSSYTFQINSANELTLDATTLNVQGNAVSNASFFASSGTVATTGILRGAHGALLLAVLRNAGGGVDLPVISVGIAATDRIAIGGSNVAGIYQNVATSNEYLWDINTTAALRSTAAGLLIYAAGTLEWDFGATALDAKTNNVTNVGFYSLSGTVAGQGSFRGGTTWNSYGLDGGTDRAVVRWASNAVTFGDTGNAGTTLAGAGRTLALAAASFNVDSVAAFAHGMATSSAATDTNERVHRFAGQDVSGTTSVIGGISAVVGGSATGGSGTRHGGAAWVGGGAGATRNGNVWLGRTSPAGVNWQSMSGGIAIQDRDAGPGAAISGASALWSESGVVRTITAIGFGTGTLPSSGYFRAPDGNANIFVWRGLGSDRILMSVSTTGPTLSVGDTTLDTTIVSEHILSGKLGATTIFDFRDSGTNAITPMNIGNASGTTFVVRAAGSTAGDAGGGLLALRGGRRFGTGSSGGVNLELNVDDSTRYPMVQVVDLGNLNARIVALCSMSSIDKVNNMPASTGDGVVYWANAVTVPTANPVGGVIGYVDPTLGVLRTRGTKRETSTLGMEAVGTFTGTFRGHHRTTHESVSVAPLATNAVVASKDLSQLIPSGAGNGGAWIRVIIKAGPSGDTTEGMIFWVLVTRSSGTWSVSSQEGIADATFALEYGLSCDFSSSTFRVRINNDHASLTRIVHTDLEYFISASV